MLYVFITLQQTQQKGELFVLPCFKEQSVRIYGKPGEDIMCDVCEESDITDQTSSEKTERWTSRRKTHNFMNPVKYGEKA